MDTEIEKAISNIVSETRFTANQLAVCNVFYNAPKEGIPLNDLSKYINKTKKGQIGGILSSLAQKIDKMENPYEKFGFSGYIYPFLCPDRRGNPYNAS